MHELSDEDEDINQSARVRRPKRRWKRINDARVKADRAAQEVISQISTARQRDASLAQRAEALRRSYERRGVALADVAALVHEHFDVDTFLELVGYTQDPIMMATWDSEKDSQTRPRKYIQRALAQHRSDRANIEGALNSKRHELKQECLSVKQGHPSNLGQFKNESGEWQ